MVDPRGSFVDLVVPGYVFCMLLELVLSRGKAYRLNDTISSLSAGVVSMLVANFLKSVASLCYISLRAWVERAGLVLMTWPYDSWPAMLVLLVLIDLGYYCAHRSAHEINVAWSGHGVHHSSEEYNLSTALRQSGLEKYFSLLFYLPLTLIADYPVFSFMSDVNMTYQFWVHTKSIRKMPAWFEYVFVTPSHHRVHHARNPRMIDRNYSGMLIIWDRLFGTFQEEDEECVYGLIRPIQTFNPLLVQCSHGWYVLTTLFSLRGFGKKMRFLFGSPSVDPVTGHKIAFPEVSAKQPKYDPVIAPRAKLWAGVFFGVFLMVPAVSWIVLSMRYLTLGQRAVSAGLLMTQMMLISFATDGRMPTSQIYYCVLGWSVAAAFFVYRISSMAFVVAVFGPLIAFSHHCLARSSTPIKQA